MTPYHKNAGAVATVGANYITDTSFNGSSWYPIWPDANFNLNYNNMKIAGRYSDTGASRIFLGFASSSTNVVVQPDITKGVSWRGEYISYGVRFAAFFNTTQLSGWIWPWSTSDVWKITYDGITWRWYQNSTEIISYAIDAASNVARRAIFNTGYNNTGWYNIYYGQLNGPPVTPPSTTPTKLAFTSNVQTGGASLPQSTIRIR